jgi:multidrug efflux pump subunit AcrA (membrane-fusion protein)
MSTEEQVDPRLVEQAQAQIRGLVDEIVALARKETNAEQFYTEFLNRVVQALAAVGGVVWKAGEGGGPEVQAQLNFQEQRLGNSKEELIAHRRLIHNTFRTGESVLVQPHSGGTDANGVNPSEYLLVLGPVKIGDETHHVVEIFQRPNPSQRTQRGYLRFLVQMCEVAANFLKNRQLQHFTDRQSLWSQLEQFTRMAHVSLEPREVAYTIANEGRRLIQCDRVSVAIRKGGKCEIASISGQDTFDTRSNTVLLLAHLATAVVKAGEQVWYSGSTKDMAPEIEEAIEGYVDECHTKQLAVIPLKRPAPPGAEPDKDAVPERPVGALIVEMIEDTRPRDGFLQRINVVSEHSSTALANAMEHNELFLMPVWRAIGKSRVLVEARNLPKTIAVVAGLVLLMIAMIIVPWSFNIHSPGKLQPIDRREVFAAVDGTIHKVHIKHGDKVEKGALLLELDNRDLVLKKDELIGEYRRTDASIKGYQSQMADGGRLTKLERDRIQGQLVEALAHLNSLTQQIRTLDLKIEKTKIYAPVGGEITTWDVEQMLLNRPVQPGQAVLSVANPAGPWEVELHMPEDRMGYLTERRAELRKSEGREDVEVTFHLATDATTQYQGRVALISDSAEADQEKGNTVLIKVAFDRNQFSKEAWDSVRPGADVAAKAHCGTRALGFVIFHDLANWFRKTVWFKIF